MNSASRPPLPAPRTYYALDVRIGGAPPMLVEPLALFPSPNSRLTAELRLKEGTIWTF